ncbi:MAG: murein hydrolase activator EnvC family protein [Alphaproteobacteria bacterium]
MLPPQSALRPDGRGAALVLAALIAFASPAQASEAETKLVDVERALEADRERQAVLARETEALSREVEALRTEMIEAAKAAQDREETVSALEEKLQALGAEEAVKAGALEAKRGQLAHLLGGLTRLALHPPEALIALPALPADTVRSAILLRAALPPLEAAAAALRAELSETRALHADIARRRDELSGAIAALEAERDRLNGLVKRKTELRQQTEAERRKIAERAKRLASEAGNLRELIEKLAAAEGAEKRATAATVTGPALEPTLAAPMRVSPPEGVRPITAARGSLTIPGRGQVIRRYGQNTEFGTPTQGITIQTRAEAQVVAPYDGQVVFADQFRGYGQILIIEHNEGYHTLLAGLSRIDCVVGQWLMAGEPVGRMGRPVDGNPELYIELRRNGQPINPLPWLMVRKE